MCVVLITLFHKSYVGYFSFFILDSIISTILMLVPLLITIAFFTLAERKVMGAIQRRRGPQIVGMWGVLQPFADGLKLIIKEVLIPSKSNRVLYCIAPALTLFLSFIGWVVIPFSSEVLLFGVSSLLYILVVSSLGLYGVLLAGWASNSKYAMFGSLRAVAQMVSYELSISLICMPVILLSGSLSLNSIVYMQKNAGIFLFTLLPVAGIFLVAILAETNRSPFDLPEAEAELVAGYNVEYSSVLFAAFFLGEYGNILLMSGLFVLLFLGGFVCSIPIVAEFCFSIKVIIVCFFFVFVRANLPRFRFDQLM
jgi:NADH-quinone oxidoreductase subunit H